MISKTLAIAALLLASTAHAGAGPYTTEAVAVAHQLAADVHGGVGRVSDTGSMEPTLTHRDIVVFAPGVEPKVGDIVVFRQGSAVVCHRIIEKAGDWFVTRGDHNKSYDPAVKAGQLIGVVVKVVDGKTGEVRGYNNAPVSP
jgi:signal peptidase I